MGTIRSLAVSKFKTDVNNDRDDKCSGCKSTCKMAENVECVKELGHDNRRITTYAVASLN
jgi:phage-related protein